MEVIIAAILAFAGTNIDDIFILLFFFTNKEFKAHQVVIGRYLGILLLISVGLAGSLASLLIAPKYIGLLGLLPVFFGVRHLLQLSKQEKEEHPELINRKAHHKTILVASVTIANGSDNIGVYVPFFATLTIAERIIVVGIFLLMVAIWCGLAWYLGKQPTVARTVDKYGHLIMPIVLILLGIYILAESGSFGLFPGIRF